MNMHIQLLAADQDILYSSSSGDHYQASKAILTTYEDHYIPSLL